MHLYTGLTLRYAVVFYCMLLLLCKQLCLLCCASEHSYYITFQNILITCLSCVVLSCVSCLILHVIESMLSLINLNYYTTTK
jgi:hypothetical protein